MDEPKQVGENAKCLVYRVQMTKQSLAWLTGAVYVTPRHKQLSYDSRCGQDMYSPDIVDGSYTFFMISGDQWQSANVVGLAENAESIIFLHTIKMLVWGKLLDANSRRWTSAVTRERGIGSYIIAEVASTYNGPHMTN